MNHPALIEAQSLCLQFDASPPVFGPLSFAIGPGLHWVLGDEGRGKTSLLRVLAGQLKPSSGRLERHAARCWFDSPDAESQQPARDWLSERLPAWPADADALLEELGLSEHAHKPIYMLSTGSRRKLGIAGALLSGAALTLIDMPFAALDARSIRVLAERFAAFADPAQGRALVLADYQRHSLLESLPAGVIELD